MSRLKQLASQTAIYGLTNIMGRLISYLITPILTAIFLPGPLGIQSVFYSYIAISIAMLSFGMETALFRFSNLEHANKSKVFSTAQSFVTFVSVFFLLICLLFQQQIAAMFGYPNLSNYVMYFAIIVFLDTLSAVPLAKLREQNEPGKFALINILNISINFGLVMFFLVYCRGVYLNQGPDSLGILKHVYRHEVGIGYVFIANIIASAIKFLMVSPIILKNGIKADKELLISMLKYTTPLAIGALAYIINEKADIIFLKQLLPEAEGDYQAGIYGANYKLAILLTIFIQAFRYAAEPFFFSLYGDKDMPQTLAKVMDFFVWFCLILFLVVTLYLDVFKWIFLRKPEYWVGLDVVPILLLANVYNGIYQNLSIWYKLSGKTMYGMYFSIIGAIITIGLNVALIPIFGFRGSAWATLVCYFSISIISYVIGQKYYPVPYRTIRIHKYILICILIYGLSRFIPADRPWLYYTLATGSIMVFIYWLFKTEESLKAIVHVIKRKYGNQNS